MGRIRTIKPELFKHERLFDLELETGLPIRVAWIGLFTVCDREGRFRWQPRKLKSDILPFDDVDFSRVLHAWWTRGFVLRYRVDGEDYGCIPSWNRHQIINNRESASEYPTPDERFILQYVDASFTRDSRVPHESTESLCNAQGEGEGEGERKGKGKDQPPRSSGDSRQDSGELTYEPIPELEPEPSTPEAEPPKPVAKPKREPAQKPSAAVDPRFTPMRELIERCCKHAKVDFIWDASEAKQLNAWLKAAGKNIPEDRCLELIRNRFRSDEPLGRRPREWIPHLSDYATPLDRFGKPRDAKANWTAVGMSAAPAPAPEAETVPEAKPKTSAAESWLRHNGDPWLAICGQLAATINQHSFETWLKPTRFLDVSGDTIRVRVPTREFKHIGTKYKSNIEAAMAILKMPFTGPEFYSGGEQ